MNKRTLSDCIEETLINIVLPFVLVCGILFAGLVVFHAYKHGTEEIPETCVTDMFGRGCP